ncbi:hypothetical protein [Mycolicibacterium sp. HK-90]|uniref:hypothetical protein n=1 Tax=Mycolicibacterium sp. HK-90 TaxID=3056937 RepID=UPI00265958C9|nr:hypothetical protein [Mycolicibacterium sp. HK-90]WKG02660.1 hypothetical protein QU592_26200 [Mycolicibacterium sp. HK-90]
MTGSVDQIPKATTEWTAQPGDARRATLSILRQPALWKRLLTFTTVVAAIAAAVCVVNGSGWAAGAAIFVGAAVVYAVFAVLVSLVCAYIPNRRVVRTGSRWAAGGDATRIRIDTPASTLVIDRSDIISVRPAGALVVLRVRPKQVLGIPTALFADPALENLID